MKLKTSSRVYWELATKSSYLTNRTGSFCSSANLTSISWYFLNCRAWSWIHWSHISSKCYRQFSSGYSSWENVVQKLNMDLIDASGFLTQQMILLVKYLLVSLYLKGKWLLVISTESSQTPSPLNELYYKLSTAWLSSGISEPVITPVIHSKYFRRKVLPDLE